MKRISYRVEHLKVRLISAFRDRLLAKLSYSKCDACPLFLMGSGRNGSTLLSAVLNNHPHLFVPGEQMIIPAVLKYSVTHPFASWQQLITFACNILEQPSQWEMSTAALAAYLKQFPANQQSAPYLLDGIYRYYASTHNKDHSIWVDKTPANTKFSQLMKAQFPKSKFVFLLRDPRDVVASYFAIGRKGKSLKFISWRWQNALRQYNGLREKYPTDVRLLKYENLVTTPQQEISQLVAWLDLNYEPTLLQNHHQNLSLLGVKQIKHHLNVLNPINSTSIGKWKEQLTPKEVRKIERTLKDNMKAVGYL